MKLIVAIVQDEDAGRTLSGLTKAGYSVTKLATSGGFLRAGNTTLLVGVEDEKVDDAMAVIEKHSHSRKQLMAPASPMLGTGSAEASIAQSPIEVTVGGATLFVLPVERFERR